MAISFPFGKTRNRLEGTAAAHGGQVPNVPDELCTRCAGCGEIQFTADIEANLNVCPKCGHHLRLPARRRLEAMCDEGSLSPLFETLYSVDPLGFPGYAGKLKAARLQGGAPPQEVLCAEAAIGGCRCAVFAMDAAFMMGSMGSVVGEKITRLFEHALEHRLPVVGFTASGGARMQEGMLSLMQMAKTSGAVKLHSDAGLLYVAVLTDPTTGGVTASFAMEGDILLAEPGALVAFAGPRVIEQTMRQKLPKGFQRAEFLLEKGFLDAVIPRAKLKAALAHILRLHQAQPPEQTMGTKKEGQGGGL